MPDRVYYEATQRGDLAYRIAQRVADAQRQLSAGQLETKEIRNAVESALRAELTFDDEGNRVRFVSKWLYVPVEEA